MGLLSLPIDVVCTIDFGYTTIRRIPSQRDSVQRASLIILLVNISRAVPTMF